MGESLSLTTGSCGVTALRSNVRGVLARHALPNDTEAASSSTVDVDPEREIAAEGGTDEQVESDRRR